MESERQPRVLKRQEAMAASDSKRLNCFIYYCCNILRAVEKPLHYFYVRILVAVFYVL